VTIVGAAYIVSRGIAKSGARPLRSLARGHALSDGFASLSTGTVRTKPNEGVRMANPVPAGSDVSSGTYQCTNCGNQIQMGSQGHIPPCPQCGNGEWDTVTGGDSVHDPYPDGDSA
jgi:hypothetical protein